MGRPVGGYSTSIDADRFFMKFVSDMEHCEAQNDCAYRGCRVQKQCEKILNRVIDDSYPNGLSGKAYRKFVKQFYDLKNRINGQKASESPLKILL